MTNIKDFIKTELYNDIAQIVESGIDDSILDEDKILELYQDNKKEILALVENSPTTKEKIKCEIAKLYIEHVAKNIMIAKVMGYDKD